ncbi:hypothetical protein GGQ68_002007 [Sagittula marina]|uniref:Uncharacterized protein n=1 Tax=Sagittula marina TaxID=943940 RepID=A0A7W6DN77_9RHOB|nr:hypothetical protein [Sagittula marina]
MVGEGFDRVTRLKGGWLEARSDAGYVLARHWPPRFDVQATSEFENLRASRLARQVRQDLWRAVQNLRGFSPVVQILFTTGGLAVTAGGRVDGRIPHGIESQIQALLDDPARRARWKTWARRGK